MLYAAIIERKFDIYSKFYHTYSTVYDGRE